MLSLQPLPGQSLEKKEQYNALLEGLLRRTYEHRKDEDCSRLRFVENQMDRSRRKAHERRSG